MRYHSKVNYFILFIYFYFILFFIFSRNISLQRCYQNGFLRIGVERRQTKELQFAIVTMEVTPLSNLQKP